MAALLINIDTSFQYRLEMLTRFLCELRAFFPEMASLGFRSHEEKQLFAEKRVHYQSGHILDKIYGIVLISNLPSRLRSANLLFNL